MYKTKLFLDRAKPCPFCGSTNLAFTSFDKRIKFFFLVCRKCFAIAPMTISRKKAVEKWNRRVID
jgi:Lar family restriction alleviation protein